MKPEELCASLTPEFIEIYNLISQLNYEDEPDYHKMIQLMKKSIVDSNFIVHKYDWESVTNEEIHKVSSIPLRMHDKPSSEIIEEKIDKGCCMIS